MSSKRGIHFSMGNIQKETQSAKHKNKWGDDYRVLVRVPHPFGGAARARTSPQDEQQQHLPLLSTSEIRSSSLRLRSAICRLSLNHFHSFPIFERIPLKFFHSFLAKMKSSRHCGTLNDLAIQFRNLRSKQLEFHHILWLRKGKHGKFLSCQ